ncbi:hypothetical protein D3C87_2143160 [compost metagenome]
MLFQASAVTISGTIQGSSMMALTKLRKGRRLLRMRATLMPTTNFRLSDQKVNWMVFCIDCRKSLLVHRR